MKAVMVSVHCDDSSHPTKRAMLETFTRGEGQGWMLMPTWSRGEGRERQITRWSRVALDAHDDLVDLGPDGPMRRVDVGPGGVSRRPASAAPWVRYRYEIECPLCDQSLQVRSEKLDPILDLLAEHAEYSTNEHGDTIGAFGISLGALAARVTSK